jgi:hypothetical protein
MQIQLLSHAVNTPKFVRGPVVMAMLASVVVAPQVCARIGETQGDIERRLLQPSVGKLFFRSKDKDNRENERQQQREEKEQPFSAVREFFPPESREGIYWKTAVASHLSNEDGWKVHVFYVAGRSALEAYRRTGATLSEFEVRALLAVNRGNSSWKKIQQEGGGTNGIGYEFELEDGSMRAKQQGNWFMIFATKLDNYVVEQQKVAKDLADQEKARKRLEDQSKAPESVAGF